MERFLPRLLRNSIPWARDNILIAGLMSIGPAIALFVYDRGHAFDWKLWWTTLWVYLAALGVYAIICVARTFFGIRAEDREYAKAQAARLWTFSAQASDLILRLETVWHHWNNADEVLLYPLDLNHPKAIGDVSAIDLITELRDLKVAYGEHLSRLGADVPAFRSKAIAGSYPSSREYITVLYDLREHAANLDQTAQRLWDSGIPLKR